MEFKIRLADKVIAVHSLYDATKNYCGDYVVDDSDEEQFRIEISQGDIRNEQEETVRTEEQEEKKEQKPQYTPQYLETLAVLRKIAEDMPKWKRFLMHGAVISWNGDAYMFTAPSGTGKSTHISLWRKYLGDQVQVINGDKPFLSVEKSEVRAYGTPWAGKEKWQTNMDGELKGICILAQAEKNQIRRLEAEEALPYLIRQIYFTNNSENAGRVLELLDELLRVVPVWYLECDISEEAVRTSFEAMTGQRFEVKTEK